MIHYDFVNVVPMRLPPLNAVRAFEAVCRHGSILKAAEELKVVRGAVRQQIATLENHFGRKLFTRDGRRLVPTPQASAFAEASSAAFDILLRAASELEGVVPGRIRLGVPSAFAVWWLMPRVAGMQASLGDTVDIVPMTMVEPLQMHPALDAVIMGGEYRPAAGITALRFMADEFGPVTTPTLAATLSKDPAAMGALTMLASRSVPKLWDEWFAESGTPPVVFSRAQEFEDLLLALGAARSGLGIALAPRASIEDDLQRGHLVAPYGFISRPSGYSLCCRTPDAKRPAFAALSGWLLRCGTPA
ncbi:LysR substrate-binding domain-containing protein [Rhizobium ruizarguesonis]|uniref:LysR substrate-binding domain-containing protein n=1 Tax=Rhizobium ruizarguesonis TaxID=2081791 RepID=UPI0010321713|nr:LysR substrate-binding domain-containing protein [Rhizobium ruizarguesonis]TAZ93519.1 LysR family transcriptional regulator [Rhizobium ruizarguesonis]TBA36421.1 LysR family transcriptional regulator [Rhizobium ruizarguesonis]TBC61746.1 LysR family transcriptional regulator [Rhizobium ruizarguesonis]WSH21717.1 LysR substrate-binding domain-containing protein [Rhizobium ruizarguesonis]WSH34626.1 LysR substrate-binding domain-containing protein [Rhizobium ruizarguesonis]